MSKLPKSHVFFDLSDYGRPIARVIAKNLKNSSFTSIHITISFIISGLISVYYLLNENYWLSSIFLILKSILDAADGELARVKNQPSYTGRYLDSIADIILNALILTSIWYITKTNFWIFIFSFLGLQLQGTLYNFYYTILRNKLGGDTTSRIYENNPPKALKGENQRNVDLLFALYQLLYSPFDKLIYNFESNAIDIRSIPNWFMTCISTFGLGFQLLIISVMLISNMINLILPFFLIYSIMIVVFVLIRKNLLNLKT